MTIYQRMAEVFSAAGIPGFFQFWRKTQDCPEIPAKFCTYNVVMEDFPLCSDDQPIVCAYDIVLHMYGISDLTPDLEKLSAALVAAGFSIWRTRGLDDVRAGEYQFHRRIDLVYHDYDLEGFK